MRFVVFCLIFALICLSVTATEKGDAPLKLDEISKQKSNENAAGGRPPIIEPKPIDKTPITDPTPKNPTTTTPTTPTTPTPKAPTTPPTPTPKEPEPKAPEPPKPTPPTPPPTPKEPEPKAPTTPPTPTPKEPEPKAPEPPKPPKPTPPCPKNETIYVDVYKKVYKTIYTPHLVHYSPHQYVTSVAAVYLTKVIKGIKQLKYNLLRYGRIIEHLKQKKLIVDTLYNKHSKFQALMSGKIETAINQNQASIKFAKKNLAMLKEALEKLHYDSNLPATCHDIKDEKCISKPKVLAGGIEEYVEKTLFSTITNTKYPAKIINLQVNKNIANYVKIGTRWVKKVVKVNAALKKLIIHQSISKLMENAEIKAAVEKYLSVLKFKNAEEMEKAKVKFIRKSYGSKFENEVKTLLASQYVKNLESTKYQKSVVVTKGVGRFTKEMVSLPELMLKKENLKKLLLTKFDIQ